MEVHEQAAGAGEASATGAFVELPSDSAHATIGEIQLSAALEFVPAETQRAASLPIAELLYRAAELSAASVLFVASLPIMAIVAIALLRQRQGSIFYLQERVGLNGRLFKIYKFRTMVTDAEKNGPFICTCYSDPRITKIGNFLRRYKLDELPQFLNVINGSMALVGPRPERPHFHEKFSRIPGWSRRVNVRPGVTGIAQISDKISHDPEQKLQADLTYIAQKSVLLDLLILLYTALPFLRPDTLQGVRMR